jgi:phospholipid/cholesterol/gamma-HCH transport system substrate-binding protein
VDPGRKSAAPNPPDTSAAARNAAAGATDGATAGPPGWLVYLPPVLALLVLIRVVAGAVPVLARRNRGDRSG